MKDLPVDDLVQAGCERERAICIHAAINRLTRQSHLHRPEDVRSSPATALLIHTTRLTRRIKALPISSDGVLCFIGMETYIKVYS